MRRYVEIARRVIAEQDAAGMEHSAAPERERASEPSRPILPRGVRLVRFEPRPGPVAIDVCSIVADVDLFIRRELEELNARLHSPVQIRGGWGVFTILDRLRQVGVELALEPTVNPDRQPAALAAQKLSPDDFGTPTGSGDSR